jgi:peroxiredoxin Q/BCP
MILQAGKRAPLFVLPDQHGEERSLVASLGQWVVLYFYPKDDTPGCTKEACGFRDGYAEFKRSGVIVWGISADSVKSHLKFSEKFSLPFPLLADEEKKVAERYGVFGKKKFGTEAKVVQPLIALRLFEGDPLIQFKYYEYFKKAKKHEDDRARRYDKSISRYQTLLKQLVPKLDWITFDEVDYSKARPYVDVGLWRQMELLKKKYDRCVNIFQQKSVGKDEFISFEEFDAGSLEIEKDVRDILKNKEKAEVLYYF